MTEYERKKLTTCPDMCVRYWQKNPFRPGVLVCPGCTTWKDENGRFWRQGNKPKEET